MVVDKTAKRTQQGIVQWTIKSSNRSQEKGRWKGKTHFLVYKIKIVSLMTSNTFQANQAELNHTIMSLNKTFGANWCITNKATISKEKS